MKKKDIHLHDLDTPCPFILTLIEKVFSFSFAVFISLTCNAQGKLALSPTCQLIFLAWQQEDDIHDPNLGFVLLRWRLHTPRMVEPSSGKKICETHQKSV